MNDEQKAELRTIFAGLRGEDDNAALRARCQAAESALRLVVRELYDILETPFTAGDMRRARDVLAKARQVLERASAPTTAWAPLQGGDLPQTPS